VQDRSECWLKGRRLKIFRIGSRWPEDWMRKLEGILLRALRGGVSSLGRLL
jgi:hypothetical protein